MKRFLIFLLACLLLCGCQAEPDPDAVDFSACETIPMEDVDTLPLIDNAPSGASAAPFYHIPTEDGVFLRKLTPTSQGGWSPDPAFLYYDDFASGKIYPVCTKSNCPHDSYDCNAYLPNAQFLHYDGEYIYYFTGTQPALWRMNPDGTDRKVVFRTTEDETSVPTILSAVYSGRKVYFTYYGAMLNPETMEMEASEYICEGDLDTGALRPLSVRFQWDRNGSTLNLMGCYGGKLFLRHSYIAELNSFYQRTEETLFLLDVDTCDVAVLVQWDWDTANGDDGFAWAPAMERGMILMREQTGAPVESTYSDGGEAILGSGNRILVDLAAGKAYRQTGVDDLSYGDRILENNALLEHWSEDRSLVIPEVLDLTTGQRAEDAWGRDSVWICVLDSHYAAGDYYLLFNYSDNGMPRYAKIKKDAYWTGDHEAIEYYPEWVVI